MTRRMSCIEMLAPAGHCIVVELLHHTTRTATHCRSYHENHGCACFCRPMMLAVDDLLIGLQTASDRGSATLYCCFCCLEALVLPTQVSPRDGLRLQVYAHAPDQGSEGIAYAVLTI